MNYFIKGSRPAEWVRKELADRGIPATINADALYCIVGGEFEQVFCKAVQQTIINSPDWEEIKPESRPKFKPGDIVMHCGGFFVVSAVSVGATACYRYKLGSSDKFIPEITLEPITDPAVRHKVREAFGILASDTETRTINFD